MTRGQARAGGRAAAAGSVASGLLPLDKPAGVTSHDAVDRARRRLGVRAIGHLGTLDPGASGLLVLAIGAATRCATVWQGGRKTYAGVVRFGVTTDTQDLSGQVLERSDRRPAEAGVRAALEGLTGDVAQVPPMFSALKRGGERLYRLARRGETLEREPRPVQVHAWRVVRLTPDELAFEVDCSGGTYVRTLAHDLGRRLGCGAALAELRRLRSEPFSLERACPWSALEPGGDEDVFARWGVPLDRALESLPGVTLTAAAAEAVGRGQQPCVTAGEAPVGAGPRSVVFRSAEGRALALGELRREPDGIRARPTVVFPWAVREGPAA
jgi:tRNA pseudouridine55 synthase